MERVQVSQPRLLPAPVGQENCGDRFCITLLLQKVHKGGYSEIKIILSEVQKKNSTGFWSPLHSHRPRRQANGRRLEEGAHVSNSSVLCVFSSCHPVRERKSTSRLLQLLVGGMAVHGERPHRDRGSTKGNCRLPLPATLTGGLRGGGRHPTR